MQIEALEPICLKFRTGEVKTLQTGEWINLPTAWAERLLVEAPGRVRRLPLMPESWLRAFREIAAAVEGITADDLRFDPLMQIIDRLEQSFADKDWLRLEQLTDVGRQVARLNFGTAVGWESSSGIQEGCVSDLTTDEDGHLWIGVPSGWVRFDRLTAIRHG